MVLCFLLKEVNELCFVIVKYQILNQHIVITLRIVYTLLLEVVFIPQLGTIIKYLIFFSLLKVEVAQCQ